MVNSEPRAGTAIQLILVHTNEGDHKPGQSDDQTAENLAAYCERECAAGRGKGYHKIVDNDSTVIMVPDDRAAWSAKGANRRSLNICLIGWAHWTREQWLQHPQMLARAAGEVRSWGVKYGIPTDRRISPLAIRAGLRGVAGHVDWSNAKLDDSDHQDPGLNFPWDILLGGIALRPSQEDSSMYLPPTLDAGGRPDAKWAPTEVIVAVSGPVAISFGFRGGFIQEAWWNPVGGAMVAKEKPIFVDQFKILRWVPPSGADFLVIRYSSPSWGAVKV